MLVAWFRNYQEIQIVSRDRYCFRDALKKQLAQLGTYQNQVSEEHLPLLAAEELTCSENRKSERLLKQVIRQEEEKCSAYSLLNLFHRFLVERRLHEKVA